MKQILELVRRARRVCGGKQAKWGCRNDAGHRGKDKELKQDAEEGGVSEGLTKAGLAKAEMDFNSPVLPGWQGGCRKGSFITLQTSKKLSWVFSSAIWKAEIELLLVILLTQI